MIFYLFIIIILLLAFIVWREYSFTKERLDFMLQIKSKDVAEFVAAKKEMANDNPETQPEEEQVPLDQLDDDQFHKLIEKSNN